MLHCMHVDIWQIKDRKEKKIGRKGRKEGRREEGKEKNTFRCHLLFLLLLVVGGDKGSRPGDPVGDRGPVYKQMPRSRRGAQGPSRISEATEEDAVRGPLRSPGVMGPPGPVGR